MIYKYQPQKKLIYQIKNIQIKQSLRQKTLLEVEGIIL